MIQTEANGPGLTFLIYSFIYLDMDINNQIYSRVPFSYSDVIHEKGRFTLILFISVHSLSAVYFFSLLF